MRIAISTDGENVSAHFGRCPEFTIVDVEEGQASEREIIKNPGHEPGFIPEFLRKKGVNCIIAGGMGHRAKGFFEQYGIQVIVGVQGSINNVIERILDGQIKTMGGESLCTPGGGKGYGVEKIHTEADDNNEHHHH